MSRRISKEQLDEYRIEQPTQQQRTVMLAALFAGLVVLAVAFNFGWPAIAATITRSQLGAARTTQATVVDKYFSGGEDPDHWILVYTFDAALPNESLQSITKDEFVAESVYDSVREGGVIDVVYNPANPAIAMTRANHDDVGGSYMALFCTSCVVMIAVMLLIFGVLARRIDMLRFTQDMYRLQTTDKREA